MRRPLVERLELDIRLRNSEASTIFCGLKSALDLLAERLEIVCNGSESGLHVVLQRLHSLAFVIISDVWKAIERRADEP